MKNMYFKKAAFVLGVAALASTGAMAEEGHWSNINNQLKNPAFIPGWSGALTATADGVAEIYNSAFELYQVVNDAPAGEYTLSANAFYRYANNDLSKENMKDGANHNAYIFLGDAKATVEGIFDKSHSVYPNNTGEANTAFAAGEYACTVKFTHAGGDLKLGIANTGGRQDEWCCFDNFKLAGPAGDVALVNGDFAEGLNVDKAQEIWDCRNIKNEAKGPDANKGGGVYRKTNASPYNFGQGVELPAGKYRFGVQSFLRYGGAGNVAGKYVTCKGEWGWVEEESALDRHNAKTEDETHNAYIYVTNGWLLMDGAKTKPVNATYALHETLGNPNGFYLEEPIKCIFDEELDTYPDNEPTEAGVNADGYDWCDSGFEYQSAKCFVNNPDKYRNYVEFELTEPATVYVGLKKDVNGPAQYWNPFRDFTLEKWVKGSDGISDVAIDSNEDAPVEYYNLQGMRVANPACGIFIVKQGKKVTKQIFK